ncbi:MAG: hypothetical protein CMB99_00220 [Flavobacteriaceae bacterium]|mgnify:FL=1|nr:hypothetical protein [Flavobacteriaceae bacterium]|tara:strand:+ start:35928 stop:36272 length:345 start_codon:yes stop_codon:yes gene_type:complete
MTKVNWKRPVRLINNRGHSTEVEVLEEYANGMARVKVRAGSNFTPAELIFNEQGEWVSYCGSPDSSLYSATRVENPSYVWVAFDPLRVAHSERHNPEYTKVDVNLLKAFVKGEK